MKVSASPSLPHLPTRNTLLDILVYLSNFSKYSNEPHPYGRGLMKVGVVNHGGYDLENDTVDINSIYHVYAVDEKPLFADDLDEYEGQDEEDDHPPLPPPIQGTQSNPLSRLNNNNTVQTTPQRDQGMPAVNLCICMHL